MKGNRAPRSPESRDRQSAAVRARWADPAHREKHMRAIRDKAGAWAPPLDMQTMYHELRTKVGPSEARRLVEDHMRVLARREARAPA